MDQLGSGKGTITKLVGERLGLINIDTGATFRAVTLAMIRQNIKTDETKKIENLLENIKRIIKDKRKTSERLCVRSFYIKNS